MQNCEDLMPACARYHYQSTASLVEIPWCWAIIVLNHSVLNHNVLNHSVSIIVYSIIVYSTIVSQSQCTQLVVATPQDGWHNTVQYTIAPRVVYS